MRLDAIDHHRETKETIWVDVAGEQPRLTFDDFALVRGLVFAPWVGRDGVDELSADGAACVRSGAAAIRIHLRDDDGRETLADDVVETVRAVRLATGVAVGVSTGAWIEPDPRRRADGTHGSLDQPSRSHLPALDQRQAASSGRRRDGSGAIRARPGEPAVTAGVARMWHEAGGTTHTASR